MIRSFLITFLKPVDRVFQVLLSTSSRRICYYSTPDYSDNAYFLYRYVLLNRRDYEHIWLIDSTSVARRVQKEFQLLGAEQSGHKLQVVSKLSLQGYFLYLRSRFVFHTHGLYTFSNWVFGRQVISLWHGMPIKCVGRLNLISPNPYPTFGTLSIATSSLFKYIMACAFGVEPAKVLVCGLPRCDALQPGYRARDEVAAVYNRLNLEPDEKFVLWMPTYRNEVSQSSPAGNPECSFLDDIPEGWIEALDREARAANCQILVKLHPYDSLNRAGTSLKFDRIRCLTSQQWQTLEVQLYDVLALSSGLISDVSSVLIDYLATDKPIAILGFDETTYTRDLTFSMNYLRRSQRYQWVERYQDISTFFETVNRGEKVVLPSGDVADMLYDHSSCREASRQILQAVGI